MSFVTGIREFGLEYFLKLASWTVPFGVFRYEHTLILAARNPIFEVEDTDQVQNHLLTENEVDQLEHLNVSLTVALERLASGDFCAAAFKESKLAAMCWSARGKIFIKDAGCPLEISPEAFYVYNALTHESARGKGLYRHSAQLVVRSNSLDGRTIAMCAISRFNTHSLDINRRVGFRDVGEVFLFRLFGLSLLWYRKWPYQVSRFSCSLGSNLQGLRVI